MAQFKQKWQISVPLWKSLTCPINRSISYTLRKHLWGRVQRP